MNSIYFFAAVVGGAFSLIAALAQLLRKDPDAYDGTGPSGVTNVARAAAGFSLRSLAYSLFGFGGTGWLLNEIGAGTGVVLTFFFAVLAGLMLGGGVGTLLAYIKPSDEGEDDDDGGFVGLPGRVTQPIRAGSPGRIVITREGREHAVEALPYTLGTLDDPAGWTQVLVLEMRDGMAYVDGVEQDGPVGSQS